MHLKRWLSGLMMAPSLILLILYAPPWLFLLLVCSLILLGLREFYSLVLPKISPAARIAGFFFGILLPLSLYSPDPRCFLAGLALAIAFFFISILFESGEFPLRIDQLSKHLLALLYVPFFLGHFILMRNLEWGRSWILFTLVAVYFGDTTAFYIGRAWGRKKMAPQISPNKTLEGGLGAVVGSGAGALLYKAFFFPELSTFQALILGIGVGAIGQLGDLFESLLKRSAQVKDSGTLIPGHGGLLDRIDSVLFVAPFVYYYAWIMT